jgi:pSer/pThr/pTyr-binding forkhead associated (FHA) protein
MADKKFTLKKLPNGAEIPLIADLSVGRTPENGLKLVEGSPSRKHALLTVTADAVSVQDLGSTNGTFVNDQRIDAAVKLKSNDKVRFDVEEYLFRIEEEAPSGDMTVRRKIAPAEVVADSGRGKVPAGWVDNAPSVGGNKTQFMTPEQMQEQRRRIASSGPAEGSAGRIDTPLLIVPGDPDGSMRVQLRANASDKQEWTVGSEGEREILIKRMGVSALHAKIVNDGKRWKVIDQLSANGTFVNGKRCNVSFLSSGDRIAFGTVECIFQLPAGAQSALASSGGAGVKKVLVIAGISFLITLVVLFLVLKKLGWV